MTDIFYPAVVGLDISLRGPSVCVLGGEPRGKVGDNQGLHVCESALIRAGEDLTGPERLSVVSDALWSWLSSRGQCTRGRLYVMEGYAFSAQSAHSIGEIGGCVRKMIWQSGGNLLVIPPSTLKKFLTGKGAGDKNIVMKHVFKRWNFDVDDDNQCDAFGCAVLGLVDIGPPDDWTAIERDILTKKVQRYAGQGQADWGGGSSPRKVAGRAGRRGASRRADLGPAVLAEDVQGPRLRRRDGSGRS